MPTPDEIIIYNAFKRHCDEHHIDADHWGGLIGYSYEVCPDPQCKAARWIEESRKCWKPKRVTNADLLCVWCDVDLVPLDSSGELYYCPICGNIFECKPYIVEVPHD